MAKFEFVKKYVDAGLKLPTRKTKESAGYDLVAADDIVIPPYGDLLRVLIDENLDIDTENETISIKPVELEKLAAATKRTGAKPTLVSTGVKCQLDPGTYLELSVRSSTPLKHWLILANGVGIIDADYYNNPDNEGEIFLQLINLSPYNIMIRKGSAIGQGIIKNYLTVENDTASGERVGGFGSTNG